MAKKQKSLKNSICREYTEIKKKYDKHAESPEYNIYGSVKDMRRIQLLLKKDLIGITLPLYKSSKIKKEELLDIIQTCYADCAKNIPYER